MIKAFHENGLLINVNLMQLLLQIWGLLCCVTFLFWQILEPFWLRMIPTLLSDC